MADIQKRLTDARAAVARAARDKDGEAERVARAALARIKAEYHAEEAQRHATEAEGFER